MKNDTMISTAKKSSLIFNAPLVRWTCSILLPVFLLLSCANEEGQVNIDRLSGTELSTRPSIDQWQVEKNGEYPYREEMLDLVMDNERLRAMGQKDLVKELGRPDRVNGDYVYYTVKQKRLGLFPLHTKSLVIKFHKNGPVEWMKIHE